MQEQINRHLVFYYKEMRTDLGIHPIDQIGRMRDWNLFCNYL